MKTSTESTLREALGSELADKIIASYKEHYDFPWQGQSHMHDCIMCGLENARRALSPTANAEMVMVPREPTDKMLAEGHDAMPAMDQHHGYLYVAKIYKAMLSATPDHIANGGKMVERRKGERRSDPARDWGLGTRRGTMKDRRK